MKIIDVNITLYAINSDAPMHAAAKQWLENALSADEPIAFPWVVLLGFLRISTHARIFERPLAPEAALEIVASWLAHPLVTVLHPGIEHWRILRELLREAGTAGNLTTDAHLAALAIENGAQLCSTDRDFGRFANLRWSNPLEPQ